MAFNPLTEQGIPLDRQLRTWSELSVEPYDTRTVDPYTRCRVIVMNGAEMESVWFGHQFTRHCTDMDLKRQLAMTRRIEAQQQKVCNWLIPAEEHENTLEVTIGYEQVAVDLTAWIARQETDPYARACYEFGLLEDFDHLYRYANLLDLTQPRKAAELVGALTEITPGRPTILEHRHPEDEIRKPLSKAGDPRSILHAMTITAAEQQTMNFYMNIGNRPQEKVARGLYAEIAQIEEQHVTHYESMLPPDSTWVERLVMHEYNEVWLYWSFMQTESDPRIRQIWETHLAMEIEQLKSAAQLLQRLEGTDPESLLPKELPEPVTFESNKAYIRKVLAEQINLTANHTEFVPMADLPQDHRFHWYQNQVNGGGGDAVPTERIISLHREEKGGEYRLQTDGPHPVDWLQDRHAAE